MNWLGSAGRRVTVPAPRTPQDAKGVAAHPLESHGQGVVPLEPPYSRLILGRDYKPL